MSIHVRPVYKSTVASPARRGEICIRVDEAVPVEKCSSLSLYTYRAMSEPWRPDSWRSKTISQDVVYPETARSSLQSVTDSLRRLPPLVVPEEIERLRGHLCARRDRLARRMTD